MAREGRSEWREDYLDLVLSTKLAEVVQGACQVLEKHGFSVKVLKSELYYSSTDMWDMSNCSNMASARC